MAIRITFLGQYRNQLGESPVWDGARQCLWWIDAMGVFAREGRVRGGRLDGTLIADWRYERAVGSIALALNGLVAAMADGFYRIERDGSAEPVALVRTLQDTVRFNDGKTDRAGQFLSGQMELAEHT